MTMQQGQLFAFGLGYVADALSRQFVSRGGSVTGTTRSAEKAAALEAHGISPIIWDGRTPLKPPAGAHWLISVPPGDTGCPAFLAAADHAATAASVTYLSTTGVYGDLGGGWAYEWTRVNPQNARAKRRVLAEFQWQSVRDDLKIVRLPGIYGPGRSAFERLRTSTARRIIKPGQVFSRVHVDDIVSGLDALLARPEATGVFHLCDDAPAPPQDVIALAAELIGMPKPPDVSFETAELSDMARSFYAECKRVSNSRAKAALGWTPTYASYEDGLRAILDVEG